MILYLIILFIPVMLLISASMVQWINEQKSQIKSANYSDSATPVAPKKLRTINISGTQFVSSEKESPATRLVKGYGISPDKVKDIRVYSGNYSLAQFPEAVAMSLRLIYEEGTALGAEVMQILHHSRPLHEAEAIYFVLVEQSSEPSSYALFAFVAKKLKP